MREYRELGSVLDLIIVRERIIVVSPWSLSIANLLPTFSCLPDKSGRVDVWSVQFEPETELSLTLPKFQKPAQLSVRSA